MTEDKGSRVDDICVIYYSRDDDCWIAHGLNTDQIGTGDCVLHALADLMTALKQLGELAAEDETIEVRRDAPVSIRKKVASAQRLPRELYEIAHKMVHGDWPNIEVKIEGRGRRRPKFTAELDPVPA